MFIIIWLPVLGTGNKCRTSSLRSWRFFGVSLFCGSQSARKMNQGQNRKRWFSFRAAKSLTLRKKKNTKIWQSFDRRQKMQVFANATC